MAVLIRESPSTSSISPALSTEAVWSMELTSMRLYPGSDLLKNRANPWPTARLAVLITKPSSPMYVLSIYVLYTQAVHVPSALIAVVRLIGCKAAQYA